MPRSRGTRRPTGEETWTFDDSELELEDETDPHLNGIARTGDGSLFIVAERGSAFRSTDGGTTWERIQLPYDGSMFGVIGYDGRHVLAYGLRGNVFESTDLGDNWTEDRHRRRPVAHGRRRLGGRRRRAGRRERRGPDALGDRRRSSSRIRIPTAPCCRPRCAAPSGGELVVAGENGVSLFQLTTPNVDTRGACAARPARRKAHRCRIPAPPNPAPDARARAHDLREPARRCWRCSRSSPS